MLRILIVDDEPFFLDFLSNYIDWRQYGAEVVGTALNGLMAQGLLQAKAVDVVITDIKMPVMDGLELICDTMDRFPHMQFIVLSSYNDFHMVGEAFKLGAKEYLLKSEITREQVAEVLANCRSRRQAVLEQERRRAEQMEIFQELSREVNVLESMLDRNRSIILKTFYNSVIERGIPFHAMEEDKQARQLEAAGRPAALLLVRICSYAAIAGEIWRNNHATFEFALTNVFEEIAAQHAGTSVFCRREGEFVFVINGEGPEAVPWVEALHASLTAHLREALSLEAVVSASLRRNGAAGLAELYGQALEAQAKSFLAGRDKLLWHDPAEGGARSSVPPDPQAAARAERFARQLALKDVGEIRQRLDEYQFPLCRYPADQIGEIRGCFAQYGDAIHEYVARNGGSERAEERIALLRDSLLEGGALSELNEWLEGVVTVLMQQEYNTTSLIRRVKRYVKERYEEELSLTVIASEMGVNPSYLSRVFSAAQGEGLAIYINRIRVQASLELLANTGGKLYEIAEKVGYNNVEHFSRMFKKIMGRSPRDYASQ